MTEIENLILTNDGIIGEPMFCKGELCYKYNISKEHRDEHPIGSWRDEVEKELILYWHRKYLIIIDEVSLSPFPYPCKYAYTSLSDGLTGAWVYDDFLEKI